VAFVLPPGLEPFFLVWSAVVGAVIGSFLNVVIARVPAGESIVHPPSRCPRCGARIAWYDNVPIASWLLLRARCRSCRAPISPRYPVVEALGAAAGALAAWRHGASLAALAELAFVALLVALSFIDLDTWTLPHALTWPLLALGLAASAAGVSAAPSLRSAAIGAVVGFAAFAAIAVIGERLLRREAMGWGDVFLLAGLGAWSGIAALLPVVLLASVQGAAVGIALLLLGKAQPGPERRGPDSAAPAADEEWVPPRNSVPFGPFLAAAALEWLYAGGFVARAVPMLDAFR
jgi:leader peptidase (prepilin peptidase) / N-methyltransferase